MTWQTVKLGDCVNILSGFAFDSAQFSTDEGIKLIRIRDVTRGFSDTSYIGQFDKKYLVKQGDILIGMDGEFNRAKWASEDALLNQRVCKISANGDILNKEYLFHLLPMELKKIEEVTPFVTVKHLSVKSIKDIQISLPPLAEQQRIAAILDKAELVKRKRELAIEKLDEFEQSIFIEMFGDSFLSKFPAINLSELCDIKGQYGAGSSAIEYNSKLPRYIRITDINKDGSLNKHSVSPSGKESDWINYYLKDGDLLFARSGATVGKSYLHKGDSNYIFAGYLIRFRPNHKKILPEYLFAYTKTNSYKSWVMKKQNVVAQPNINAQQYGELKIPSPPIDLQLKFVDLFKIIKDRKKSYLDALNLHTELSNSIQSKAFSGQL